jgi:hypothetical protein
VTLCRQTPTNAAKRRPTPANRRQEITPVKQLACGHAVGT